MAFTSPSLDSILAGILRDIRSLESEADIESDSDHYVRSAAVAAAIEGLYQKLAWTYRQIFPDSADEDEMVRAATLRGLDRKEAVASRGPVALQGTPGVELLIGSTIKHVASGELFTALTSAKLGTDGTAIVMGEAQTSGAALNDLAGAAVLTSPPLGMSTTAAFVGSTSGGVDQESAESLLARLLEDLQTPPAGGSLADYKRWAKEVDGVDDALVLPKRRGAGTVDVIITGSTGVPPVEVVAKCLANIESQCSVISDVWVFVPAVRVVNSTADVELADDYLLEEVQVMAQSAYETLLGAMKPRDMLKRSQIEAMVNNLPGVIDRAVRTPANNLNASDNLALIGWIRPGTITLGLMQ
ncbi:baseplate J/gp47 family protein [Pseudomonas sp. DSP3-2-2]|uniref:baseplate J/gp47 family protein n=1 Tax=unclassified Pseudomonas TaxID=196821 RepID=UPI003CFB623C